MQLLRTLHATIVDTEKLIATRLAEHPRAQLLRPLPGVGMINLAQLLAVVGPILDRVASAELAATGCGAAPATTSIRQMERGVCFRWVANTGPRRAMTSLARNPRMQSPWTGQLTPTRARGKRHPMGPASSRAAGSASPGLGEHRTPYGPATILHEELTQGLCVSSSVRSSPPTTSLQPTNSAHIYLASNVACVETRRRRQTSRAWHRREADYTWPGVDREGPCQGTNT